MRDAIFWFGVAHLAVYAIAGFSVITMRLMDGVVKRTGAQRVILQWWFERLKKRHASGNGGVAG